MATPEERQIAKELMLACISHEKTNPGSLFTAPVAEQRFEAIWDRILRAVSGQPPKASA
jgi:hypothetical protein